MKGSNTRLVIGVLGVIALLVLVSQYQNCSIPKGGGSSDLSSSSSATFYASAPAFSQQSFGLGSALGASSQISGGSGSITCQWAMYTSPGGTLVAPALAPSLANGGTCSLSTTAPSTVGNYTLTVTASDGVDTPSTASSILTVGTQSPGPTPATTPFEVQCHVYSCLPTSGQCLMTSTVNCISCPNGNNCQQLTNTSNCISCGVGGGCLCGTYP